MEIKQLTDRDEFEQNWARLKNHLLQSWEWGEIKKPGWMPLRIAMAENKQLIAQFSILIRKLPLGLNFAYIPKASLPQDRAEQILHLLEKYLVNKKLASFIIIEFNIPELQLNDYLLKLPGRGGSIQPQCTNIVDLKGSEQELWRKLKGNYRRNINKARRQGVTIKTNESGSLALDQFYDVMSDIFANSSYVMHEKSYFQRVWQFLESNKARIFIAEHEDRIVGAYLVGYDELGAYEFYGGVTRSGRDVEAGYLLKWESMLAAQKQGKEFYDHWGVAPRNTSGEYDPTHELGNISKFKEGFAGQDVCYPEGKILRKTATYYFFSVLELLQKLNLRVRKIK